MYQHFKPKTKEYKGVQRPFFFKLENLEKSVIFSTDAICFSGTGNPVTYATSCLVPVRRFLSPFRSIHCGDVSKVNGWEMPRQKENAHACVAF